MKTPKVKTPKVKTPKVRGESKLDVYLARAQERFGSKLPNWVFGRWGIVAAVAVIALCVIFAELVSNLLLIAGVMVVLLGGVTMLDSVIARRVLHHKVTPTQVLIGRRIDLRGRPGLRPRRLRRRFAAPVMSLGCEFMPRTHHSEPTTHQTSSMIASSAPSPRRGPSLVMRV